MSAQLLVVGGGSAIFATQIFGFAKVDGRSMAPLIEPKDWLTIHWWTSFFPFEFENRFCFLTCFRWFCQRGDIIVAQ